MNALLIVCGLGFVSLLAEIINLKKGLHILIVIGLIAAIVFVAMDTAAPAHYFKSMLVFDKFSLAFTGLIILISVFWFCISSPYFLSQSHQTDRSALVLFCIAGGIMMVSFQNLTMLFLGIEILSVSLYVLAGSSKDSFFSNEAAFKYFIMGSFATGFLLMGIALVYGSTGSFDISKIGMYLQSDQETLPDFFYVGLFLILIGIAFKISVVPFHFWVPDVYSGAPTVITAFMSTVVKVAAVGAFYKIFAQCFISVQPAVIPVLQTFIVLTLIVANVTAVYQKNMKRMLAYSSVAHVGYILLGFVSGTPGVEGILFYYLASYAITSLAAFGCLGIIENVQGSTSLENMIGLYLRNPFLAICMTTALLSLAGIPPLAGFFAKYVILSKAIDANYIGMVILAITTSLVGVYYYFRPIVSMFSSPASVGPLAISSQQKLIIGVLTVFTLLMGLFPDSVLSIAR